MPTKRSCFLRVRDAIVPSGWTRLLIAVFPVSTVSATKGPAAPAMEQRIQAVVASVTERLSISSVVVSIVATNPLMMSVQAPAEEGNPCHLAVG